MEKMLAIMFNMDSVKCHVKALIGLILLHKLRDLAWAKFRSGGGGHISGIKKCLETTRN